VTPWIRRFREKVIRVNQNQVLTIEDLCVEFKTDFGVVRAVDGLSLSMPSGSSLGVVGESGCGKSTLGLAIMGLLPQPHGYIARGKIYYKGEELTGLSAGAMRAKRGAEISMIFQEPMTSLNPVKKVGKILAEVIRLHKGVSTQEAKDLSIEALDKVRLPSPELRIDDYPHEMSGGMRQRVMIALAMCCDPSLIIADEPTTALDVTVQAQIMALLSGLREETGSSVLLITHDLGVISENTDLVAVMYAGRLMEYATTTELFDNPMHPYTLGLLKSIPGRQKRTDPSQRLYIIPGQVPNLLMPPPGCRFANRCADAWDKCREAAPPLVETGEKHLIRCWKYVKNA
jgi:oligopeptide/dipeptide ABC transporter ATP-binding protein